MILTNRNSNEQELGQWRLLLLALTLTTTAGFADEGLITDRPDFTESTVAVDRGRWQIETGASWLNDDAADGYNLPQALIRAGLAERWELRVGLPDYVDTDSVSGLTDASLGVKLELGDAGPGELALIAEVSLPVGDDEFSSDEVDPTLIVIYGQDLSSAWSLGSQVAVSSVSVGDDELTVVAPTLVFGTQMRPDWGAFFELAAEIPDTGRSSVLFHTGLTWARRPTGQWDAHLALGLSDAAPDVEVGVGYSFAF